MKTTRTFIRLGKRVPAVLYEPAEPGDKARISVLVMHSDEDYLTCPTGEELAARGYRVLCANVMNKEGILFTQNEKMASVNAAVCYLRERPDIDKVILMGHSGGATLMSAYQAIAENGPDLFKGEEMLYPYDDSEALTPADGLMLLDANWGNAVMQLFSLDPAVTDERSGLSLDPSLNLFEPVNGFRHKGSDFSREFIERFQRAQGERNNRILDYALDRLEKIRRGEGYYTDDEPLCIPGAAQSFFNNKLYAQDIRLFSHSRDPHPLIHRDGSVTTQIIPSVRRPENPESFTHSYREGARFLTVRTYLSSYAVRTLPDYGYDETSVRGIEWKTTYAAPPGNVTHISCPTLVMGMTGGWEFMAAETIYDMSAASDKHIAYVEGASHKFKPARPYEAYPGQFGDTMKLLHDYVDGWLSAEGRFAE